MNTLNQSFQRLRHALQDENIFRSFQSDPIALSAKYGVELTPEFAKKLKLGLQNINTLEHAQLLGKSGFRMECGPEQPDDGTGRGGGYALPGIGMPIVD